MHWCIILLQHQHLTCITVTSKTLIDYILYNTFAKNYLPGNIATSISDNIYTNDIVTNSYKRKQKTHWIKNRLKYEQTGTIPKINFWNNYLKANQNDPHHFFELFFQKPGQLFDKYCPEKSHWKREKIFTKTLDNQRNSKIYYIEN